MDKKKIITYIAICIVVFAVGIAIGVFVDKDATQDVSSEITTTVEEVLETPSETEEITQGAIIEVPSETKEPTQEEITAETTIKAAEYTQVSEIVYATSSVNIRAGVGTSTKIIGVLKKGDKIKRTAIGDNGWSRVSYNGKTAYVFSKYLTKTSPDSSSVDMCGISNTDAKNLTDLLEYIFFYGVESYEYEGNVKSYDYRAKNAFENAFTTIYGAPFYNFCELVSEIYRIHYEGSVDCTSDSEDNRTDPRGYWQQYRYIEADFVDFVLENMFNVKPDHNYIFKEKGWDGEVYTYAYYEKGYYYSDASDGGDGCGPEVTVKKVEILPDGKYRITVHYRIVTGGENGELVTFIDGGDINVVAEMKNIDENSIWSFYEINEVK